MNSNKSPRKNPIHLNEGFRCKKCGKENPKADVSCRNHCRFCLYSLHVDLETPGDRASDCLGLMSPEGVTQNGKKGWQILHKCLKCEAKKLNMVASDDNSDLVIELTRRQNLTPLSYGKSHGKKH